MKFFEKFTGSRVKEVNPLEKLHPDFRYQEGEWYFNATESPATRPRAKVRFAFDDPTLLDSCPVYAKIGINRDSAISSPYIGFAYVWSPEQAQQLKEWVSNFPYAELIEELGTGGVSTETSPVKVLKNRQEEKKRN